MNTIDIDTGGTFTDGVFRVNDHVVTVKLGDASGSVVRLAENVATSVLSAR